MKHSLTAHAPLPKPWGPLLLVLLLTPCTTIIPGAPAPDFTPQYQALDRNAQRLILITKVMQKDLDSLSQFHTSFFAASQSRYARPFPIDLFKQAAMDCLNQTIERTGDPTLPQPSGDLRATLRRRFGVDLICHPPILQTCLDTISKKTPERLSFALEQIERVDRVRRLRAKLKERASKIPLIVQQTRESLATLRADRRRLVSSIELRKEEFNKDTLLTIQKRIALFDAKITRVEESIETLEVASAQWLPTLERKIDNFYFDLTALHYRKQGTLKHDPSRNTPI